MELHEIEIRSDDELNSLVAKAMVTVVAAMALLVMVTVIAFHAGGTII